MKNFFIINDTLENKITYFHLALFLIFLPFHRFYTEVILISLTIHTILHVKKHRLSSLFSLENLMLASVFLTTIIALSWSADKKSGYKDVEHQLSILLIPCVLTLTNINLIQYKKRLLTIFGVTCMLTITYLYLDALRIIIFFGMSMSSLFSWSFVNHNFSLSIGMHATYLSMFAAVSITAFISYFIGERNKRNRLFYLAMILVLFAGLFQLAAKSVLISIVALILPGFLLYVKGRTRRLLLISTTLIAFLAVFYGITRIGSFKKRYLTELRSDLTAPSLTNQILEPRMVRWQSILPLVGRSPLIGYGTGTEKNLLAEQYYNAKLYDSYLRELNAHNEYLSMLVRAGLLGLAVYLVTIFSGFAAAWKSKDLVFTAFMILITVASFSENILDVNKGIFFYAFFFSFFMKSRKPIV